jgi:hypothetical protein
MLPPGWLKLGTKPISTGSPAVRRRGAFSLDRNDGFGSFASKVTEAAGPLGEQRRVRRVGIDRRSIDDAGAFFHVLHGGFGQVEHRMDIDLEGMLPFVVGHREKNSPLAFIVRSTSVSEPASGETDGLLSARRRHFDAHSITLSARNTSPGGTSCPIALAALRLMTSSNRAGCSTGMSVGLVPRRIFTAIRAR